MCVALFLSLLYCLSAVSKDTFCRLYDISGVHLAVGGGHVCICIFVCFSMYETESHCVAVGQLMTSLILSRSSEDVREQLPRVDESVVLCPLSRRQSFIYSDYLANRFCFSSHSSGLLSLWPSQKCPSVSHD